jgi:hypothetical protein
MKEAIQKAIEGGYEFTFIGQFYDPGHPWRNREIAINSIFDDPLFWQALGKAMGWREKSEVANDVTYRFEPAQWQLEWHRFIDHLAEGKDAESFFKELLK